MRNFYHHRLRLVPILGHPLMDGTQGWARPSVPIAEEERNIYGLAKIAELMGIPI
jgi:hypothetical protein